LDNQISLTGRFLLYSHGIFGLFWPWMSCMRRPKIKPQLVIKVPEISQQMWDFGPLEASIFGPNVSRDSQFRKRMTMT
jgi:hypothetical protein